MPARVEQEQTTAAVRFRRLQDLTSALSEALTFQRVAAVVTERSGLAADAASAALVVLSANEAELEVAATWTRGEADSVLRERIPLKSETAVARALRQREPVLLDGHAALPLTVRNRTIGAIAFGFDGVPHYDEETRAFLGALAQHAALAIERAQLHELEQQIRAEADEEAARFRSLVQELDAIFWEADPATIEFSFVSNRAETILGYPIERWTKEPSFWASILHPEDREWAVPFCIECTKKGQDHAFEYRVIAADGRTVWLRDIVYVVRDHLTAQPAKLRGVMVDITRERADDEGRVARVLPSEVKARPASGLLPAALRVLAWSSQGITKSRSRTQPPPHMRG